MLPPPFSASTSTTGDWKLRRCSSCDRVNHSIWRASFAPLCWEMLVRLLSNHSLAFPFPFPSRLFQISTDTLGQRLYPCSLKPTRSLAVQGSTSQELSGPSTLECNRWTEEGGRAGDGMGTPQLL